MIFFCLNPFNHQNFKFSQFVMGRYWDEKI